jgi:hypothetical protein
MKSFHDIPIPETSQQRLSLLLLALQHSETRKSRLELCSGCGQVRLDKFHFILPHANAVIRVPMPTLLIRMTTAPRRTFSSRTGFG